MESLTKSKIHDFVRNMPVVDELKNNILLYLDGKRTEYGEETDRRNMHEVVKRTMSTGSPSSASTALFWKYLEQGRYQDQFNAYKAFIDVRSNWEDPKDLGTIEKPFPLNLDEIAPLDNKKDSEADQSQSSVNDQVGVNDQQDIPNDLSRRDLQEILRKAGVRFGGRTKRQGLLKKVRENGLL